MKPWAVVLLIVGGILLGATVGGLVHEAVTRLAPPHQIAEGEGRIGAVGGLGLALMILAGWINRRD